MTRHTLSLASALCGVALFVSWFASSQAESQTFPNEVETAAGSAITDVAGVTTKLEALGATQVKVRGVQVNFIATSGRNVKLSKVGEAVGAGWRKDRTRWGGRAELALKPAFPEDKLDAFAQKLKDLRSVGNVERSGRNFRVTMKDAGARLHINEVKMCFCGAMGGSQGGCNITTALEDYLVDVTFL